MIERPMIFPSAWVYLTPEDKHFVENIGELGFSLRLANGGTYWPEKLDVHNNPPPFQIKLKGGKRLWATKVRVMGKDDNILGAYILSDDDSRVYGEYRYRLIDVEFVRVRVMPFYRQESAE